MGGGLKRSFLDLIETWFSKGVNKYSRFFHMFMLKVPTSAWFHTYRHAFLNECENFMDKHPASHFERRDFREISLPPLRCRAHWASVRGAALRSVHVALQ